MYTKFWDFHSSSGNPYVGRVRYHAAQSIERGDASSLIDGVLASRLIGYLVKSNILGISSGVSLSCYSTAENVSADDFYVDIWGGTYYAHTYIFPSSVHGEDFYNADGSPTSRSGGWNTSTYIGVQTNSMDGLLPPQYHNIDPVQLNNTALLSTT